MGNLWSRSIGRLKGLFAKKGLEEAREIEAPPIVVEPAPVEPVVDTRLPFTPDDIVFTPDAPQEPVPPVVMLEGVVPMVPAPLVHVPSTDPFSPAPLAPEEKAFVEDVEERIARGEPSEPAPAAPAEAPQPDPEPAPAVQALVEDPVPVPVVAREEPVVEPAAPDQSDGWFARLWQSQAPEEGEGLAAPSARQMEGLLTGSLAGQPVPNIIGGGQLGFLCARSYFGGL